jgi:Ca2+/Na+ antiporter
MMIVLVAAGIIAIILFAMGSWKNKRMLRTVGISLYVGFAVCLFIYWTEFREIIIALAAVAAVIIAAFSIYQSKQLRQDSIDRESRDRRERWLNEVAEWLRELEDEVLSRRHPIKSTFEDMLRTKGQVPLDTWLQLDALHIALTETSVLSKSIREAEYYRKLTSKLDEGLSTFIGVVVSNLKQRRQLVFEDAKSPQGEIARKIQEGTLRQEIEKNLPLMNELIENDDRPLEGLGLSNQDITVIHLGRNAKAIKQSVLDALARAIELKTNLIEVG